MGRNPREYWKTNPADVAKKIQETKLRKRAAVVAQNEIDQMKTCVSCKERKPFSDFYPDRSGKGYNGLDQRCSACLIIKAITWNRANPEKHVEHERRYRLNSPEKAFIRDQRRRFGIYGLSLDDLIALYEFQGGKCAICRLAIEMLGKQTHLDHCHESNRIRALLCRHCNGALGYLRDSPEIAIACAKYLDEGGIFRRFLASRQRPDQEKLAS